MHHPITHFYLNKYATKLITKKQKMNAILEYIILNPKIIPHLLLYFKNPEMQVDAHDLKTHKCRVNYLRKNCLEFQAKQNHSAHKGYLAQAGKSLNRYVLVCSTRVQCSPVNKSAVLICQQECSACLSTRVQCSPVHACTCAGGINLHLSNTVIAK